MRRRAADLARYACPLWWFAIPLSAVFNGGLFESGRVEWEWTIAMPYELLALVGVVLWVYCLVDVAMAPRTAVRRLPKAAWVIIVFGLPLFGGLVWMIAGSPESGPRRRVATTRFAEYDRPGRYVAQDPAADDAFLAGLRERAQRQQREAHRSAERQQAEQHRRWANGEL
ncbi:PLD nuclease N-terminal domain-containing protein [Nocardia sp. NPDC058658]|uniref:PLD nuclease N-terminal domain-containing protein n=1 Tax=Nocardia sp. NPDC058658 TaxID=3346580 RepID=UPI00365BE6A9